MRSDGSPSGAAPAAPEGCLRIVSWNCRGAGARKGAHLTALGPDLAAVPEAGSSALRETSLDWSPAAGALAGPRPELGLFAFGATRLRVHEPHAGDALSPLIAATVEPPGAPPFTALAVCARPAGAGPRHGRYARALLDALDRHAGLLRSGPAIVLGDFNSATALDRRRRRRDHLDVVDALAALGLASAWHHVHGRDHGDEDAGTFHMHGWPHSPPLHLDYCFVPEGWLPRIRTAWIGPADPWLSRSDHLPLVVDVAVGGA